MDKIRIILVDDHLVVREGTRQVLEREADFEIVGEAGNGREAVRLARELRPDVAIMDVAMPEMSGIEATKQIKKEVPSVAVLVLTGYDYDEYIFSLLEAGAAGYLLKTVTGDELITAIRAVNAGEPVLHPIVIRKLMTRLKPQSKPVETALSDMLSEREIEVLKLAAKGMSNKDIGKDLCISSRTVQAHLRSIFTRMSVGSRSEAVLYGLKRGWFTLEDLP